MPYTEYDQDQAVEQVTPEENKNDEIETSKKSKSKTGRKKAGRVVRYGTYSSFQQIHKRPAHRTFREEALHNICILCGGSGCQIVYPEFIQRGYWRT
jgi:hypothetical protein